LGGWVIDLSIKLYAIVLALVTLVIATIAASDIYAVNVANSEEFGLYMTNASFYTLYHYLGDNGKGKSTCYDSCVQSWPPFYVENLTVNPELKTRDFSVITRDDGIKQLVYRGWPLYLFIGDTKPNEIQGQGKNGVWFIVEPQNLTK
jgi:predicted lipoprotein with Yx(FWY)xxD motif